MAAAGPGPALEARASASERGAADLEAFRAAKHVLDEGHVLGIFPGGHAEPDGALQEAKDGLAILAMRTGGDDPAGRRREHRSCSGRAATLAATGGWVATAGRAAVHPATRRRGSDPREAQAAATDEIMGRDCRPAAASPARRLCRRVRQPADRLPEPGRITRPREILARVSGTVEEIRIARRTGFCYGVREAIDKAKEAAAAGKATHTLGQVVHNEGVVRDLLALGIESVETLDEVDHGAAVVIRAHGVRPEVMERANERGLEVIDGTCTWVIQEQRSS